MVFQVKFGKDPDESCGQVPPLKTAVDITVVIRFSKVLRSLLLLLLQLWSSRPPRNCSHPPAPLTGFVRPPVAPSWGAVWCATGCGVVSSVHVTEGEACEIRENTRPSLVFAAELLGVEADKLEKAAVSKTMAVRGKNKIRAKEKKKMRLHKYERQHQRDVDQKREKR